jgi:hypothetical protein
MDEKGRHAPADDLSPGDRLPVTYDAESGGAGAKSLHGNRRYYFGGWKLAVHGGSLGEEAIEVAQLRRTGIARLQDHQLTHYKTLLLFRTGL